MCLWASASALSAQNLIQNPSFESPTLTSAFQGVSTSQAGGWLSNNGSIEYHQTGSVGPQFPESFDGTQHIELQDVPSFDSDVFQDVTTVPGTTMEWSFAHRGRLGTESVELRVGAPGSEVVVGIFSAGVDDWVVHSGTYVVPAGQTTTRYRLKTDFVSDTCCGNLIDQVEFATVPHVPAANGGILFMLVAALIVSGGRFLRVRTIRS